MCYTPSKFQFKNWASTLAPAERARFDELELTEDEKDDAMIDVADYDWDYTPTEIEQIYADAKYHKLMEVLFEESRELTKLAEDPVTLEKLESPRTPILAA